ncbi:UNVERIFIED_CONTAM: hypothetical protein RMT77_002850 [Armadillidium vulgare]
MKTSKLQLVFVLSVFCFFLIYVWQEFPNWYFSKIGTSTSLYSRNNLPKEKIKFIEMYEKKADMWKESIARKCQLYSKYLVFKSERHHMLFSKEAKMGYCWNAKAGSSTNLRIWLDMHNITEERVNLHAIQMFNTSSDLSEFPDILKYTMVRHPFIRLMSYYLKMVQRWKIDKFQQYRLMLPNSKQWKILLRDIDLNASERVTPWEFLMHVVEQIETCKASDNPLMCLYHLDMHYKPYYISCSPCALHFDVIAKLETFEEDYTYIACKIEEIYGTQNNHLWTESKSLNSEKTSKQEWILKILNDSIRGPKSNPSDFEIITSVFTTKVFNLLSADLKRRLREAYFFDFLLFEYDQYEFS